MARITTRAKEDPPRRVGVYSIRDLLASGGFGAVFRAEHAERGTPAAVKIMHAQFAENQASVARFAREFAIMQRVRHPSVLEVFDWGRLPDGRPYLVMELLAGVSLEQHLASRGKLPVGEVLAILEPLCGALAAAHACDIVHRDVKPSNVFLAAAPGASPGGPEHGRVVLLDFGVAKLLDADGEGRLTLSGHVVGTFACMSPEQILSKPVDARTDLYALGALVYRMLTGVQPFVARNAIALQQMLLYTAPRPPSASAAIAPALDAPILRALSKAPEARQPSVEAFFAELREAAGR